MKQKNNNFTAKAEFSKKIARRSHKTDYYKCNEFTINNMDFMTQEKNKLKTEDKFKVSNRIQQILDDSKIQEQGKVFDIIQNIYNKNQKLAFKLKQNAKTSKVNGNLLNILADPSLLMVSYKKVRKNSGAMTEAYEMSLGNYDKLDAEQKSWINKTSNGPDGITNEVILLTSKMIKENKYPWGSSRRIYVDKPGKKDVKRPITIPPFMDKVVQEALTTILMSIYEPFFESQNCSFGFRPNKGVHDAIISLTNSNSTGMKYALEGDIKSAYDKVDRSKLIEILGKKIKDRNFLNFIKKRLNYEYYDTEQKKYVTPNEGLPQGSIDAPYLWNIYMSEFDDFIINHLSELTNKTNLKTRGKLANDKKMIPFREKRKIDRKITTLRKIRSLIKDISKNNENDQKIFNKLDLINSKTAKELLKEGIFSGELLGLKEIFKTIGIGKIKDIRQIVKNTYDLEKEWKILSHTLPSGDPNKIRWRFIYTRYCDDWLLVTNMKQYALEKIKEDINSFLFDKLKATLSIEKTLLTNIKETPAHFLGYEVSTYKGKKIGNYIKKRSGKTLIINAITAGSKLFVTPDRQRIIERLHMKGYCDPKGFPREIGFLSTLDDFSIIERYNSVLLGMSLYYCEFIKNPKKNLSRWFYIIRYSCLKTIAQKHKLTLREVFKNYIAPRQINSKSKEHTIKVDVVTNIEGDTYKKTWTLYTPEQLIEKALLLGRKEKLFDIYWQLQKGKPVIYESNNKSRITNDNFYEKINWINIRTKSSFNLPCSLCGMDENIEMHHIKHVRKNRYELIDKESTWMQAMSIRNRKQIPVCRACHINVIHRGKYGGTKLSTICPKIMYDNRILTIESHINKRALSGERINIYKKTLQEKGWILINQ